MNEKLMQLKDVDISVVNIKMKVLDRFNEDVKPLNKMRFPEKFVLKV